MWSPRPWHRGHFPRDRWADLAACLGNLPEIGRNLTEILENLPWLEARTRQFLLSWLEDVSPVALNVHRVLGVQLVRKQNSNPENTRCARKGCFENLVPRKQKSVRCANNWRLHFVACLSQPFCLCFLGEYSSQVLAFECSVYAEIL